MIITVTANAAVDKTLTVPSFRAGHRHRSSESLTLPGGKGINIARGLKTLGAPVVATGFVGGLAGQQVTDGLQQEGLLHDFVRIEAQSRTSTVVVDPTAAEQTEIIEYGPSVNEAEVDELLDKITYLARGARFLVLAGSLPRHIPAEFYCRVIEVVRALGEGGCYIALDSAAEPLRQGVRGRPDLVCPNAREAEDLVGHEFHDEHDDVVEAVGTICEMGAKTTIVKTAYGCVARFGEAATARTYVVDVPPVEAAVSRVGSGDAFLAGYIGALYERLDEAECLRRAVAVGAANALSYGAGVLSADDVESILPSVAVSEVETG